MRHPTIERATGKDLEQLLRLIKEFYLIDQHCYDEERLRSTLPALLGSEALGVVWKLGSPAEGYAVVTWSYSLESGGHEALIDELYVRSRNNGIGTRLLAHILDDCRDRGVMRVFLETESHNSRVRNFYRRSGFAEDDSIWMSQWL